MSASTTARPFITIGALTAPIARLARRMGRMTWMNSAMNRRLHDVQRLEAMTDAELAEFGIARDDIVRYVFRDLMHI